MGIRCWCPNGHKLNIKAFQAGKRGICPYCGARFTIPLESTRKPGMGDRIPEPMEHSVHEGPVLSPPSTPASATPGWTAGTTGEPIPFLSAPTPLGIGTASKGTSLAPSSQAPSEGGHGEVAFGQHAATGWATPPLGTSFPIPAEPPIASPPPGAASDPLAEAPNAVWYVRPPTGGQFGPATADVMRNWIAEGRVSPDSLVWREGWRDWQEAGHVFPQLVTPSGLPTSVSWASESSKPQPRKKTASTHQNLWLLVLLVLAVAVLLGVFIYVAFWAPPLSAPPSAPPASSPSGS
ncbi:MAG: GYF domain-containing protein [Thermoguttaceae bacterium]|nr:GYF domain-containing protein [Thermoguttaceae bacterium]MDW8036925.1 GYF domain-containing protein [Thermoguttaceae bacterium]